MTDLSLPILGAKSEHQPLITRGSVLTDLRNDGLLHLSYDRLIHLRYDEISVILSKLCHPELDSR